jgi:hypothetical protein
MMGGVSPETCWASCKCGIINFDTLLHLVGFFCMNSNTSHIFHSLIIFSCPNNSIPVVREMQNPKDVCISVSFYHIAVEWSVKLVYFWQAMFNLYFYCQEHKNFSLSYIRLGRRSVIKTVHAPEIISVHLHHTQCDNPAKYNMKTPNGVEPSLMCNASPSFFPLWPTVNVCITLFWRQEGSVHCKSGAHCVWWFGPLWTSSSSSEITTASGLSGAWAVKHTVHTLCDRRFGSSETSQHSLSSTAATLHWDSLLSLSIIGSDTWFGFNRWNFLLTD